MGQSPEEFMDESNIPKSVIEDNTLGTSFEDDSWSDLDNMSLSEEVHWKQLETKPGDVVPEPLLKTESILRTGKTNEVNYWGPTVSFNEAIWTKKEISKKGSTIDSTVLGTGPLNLIKSWDKTSSSQTLIVPVKRRFTIEATLNTTPSTAEKGSKVGLDLPRRYRHRHGHALEHRHRHKHRYTHQGHRQKENRTTKSYWLLKNIPQIKPHNRYSIMSNKNVIIANKTAKNTKELKAIIKRNKNVLESERTERREEMKRKKKSEVKMLNLRDPKIRGVVKELLQRILSRKRERKRTELPIENESYELKRNLNKALLGNNMSTKFKKGPINLNFNNRKIDLSDFTESSHENLERVFKRKLRLGLQKSN